MKKLKALGIDTNWLEQSMREKGEKEEDIKTAVRLFNEGDMGNWTEEDVNIHEQLSAYLRSEAAKIPDMKPTDKLGDKLPPEVWEKGFRLLQYLKYGEISHQQH
jgi:hypothetical protein